MDKSNKFEAFSFKSFFDNIVESFDSSDNFPSDINRESFAGTRHTDSEQD
ncbi:MAG: hypothetical protein K2X69_11795 [Silvanigrellaceae bacterium]|nr:hypothetical protein [Silvanigrellaceae bacterium]